MKIAVFHHGVLHSSLCQLTDMAEQVLLEQIHALNQSGLAAAADELHMGINDSDVLFLSQLAPPKAIIHPTGDGSQGEKPTMMLLEKWLPGHEGWAVCYHHMKGCTNGKHAARKCMENAVIWNWQRCLKDLARGYDAVGCHWLDYRRHPIPPGHRIFGGNFWWSTYEYLSKIPPLNPKVDNGKYFEGEIWIGRHPGEPRVRDYHSPASPCAL